MSRIPTFHKLLITGTIALGLVVCLLLLMTNKVSIESIKYKKGRVINPTCVESHSSKGIKFLARYSGQPVEDYVSLPLDINCQEIVSEFNNGKILIAYFNNKYFGVSINGRELRNTELQLSKFNDKSGSIAFILFVISVSVFTLYFRGSHVARKAD